MPHVPRNGELIDRRTVVLFCHRCGKRTDHDEYRVLFEKEGYEPVIVVTAYCRECSLRSLS